MRLTTRTCRDAITILLCSIVIIAKSAAEPSSSQIIRFPAYCDVAHNAGKIMLLQNNGGALQPWFHGESDAFTGCSFNSPPPNNFWMSIEYPTLSNIAYAWGGAMWIGGVTGEDTAVSVGAEPDIWYNHEFFPEPEPFGRTTYRSSLYPDSFYYEHAVSEQDFVSTFSDTFTNNALGGLEPDYFDSRPHIPLGLSVHEESYQWGNAFCDDFILLNYAIENVGSERLSDIYVGFYMEPFVMYLNERTPELGGSFGGFLHSSQVPFQCNRTDSLGLAWWTDNNGDPVSGKFVYGLEHRSPTAGFALRFMGERKTYQTVGYNWWKSSTDPAKDFGPRMRPPIGQLPHDFGIGGGTGTPKGDRNKYFLLSNGEIDYDVAHSPRMQNDQEWLPLPPGGAASIATGAGFAFLLSTGPFSLEPGDRFLLPVCMVAGENVLTDPDNTARLLRGEYTEYDAHIDFSQLVKNALAAEWAYDNPGYDSDSDGYAGKYTLCGLDSIFENGAWVITAAETTWYRGDGVPDWRAATAPPAPQTWVTPVLNGLHIRFNGARTETTRDAFTQLVDFEGYNIYIGRDDRDGSLSIAASYDRENYDQYIYDATVEPDGEWVLRGTPKSLEQLRCNYGRGNNPCADSLFDPLSYSRDNPLRLPQFFDSVFYFVRHGFNASSFGVSSLIKKRFPDQPKPGMGEEVPPDALTDDGYLKYYEYECTIQNLLPTVEYFLVVTAFDFGAPESKTEPLESSKRATMIRSYPLADREQLSDELPPVYIYPNPYIADGRYRDAGFEGRGSNRIPDRDRRIHFVNVPSKCVISIFTLDGDLVRQILHNADDADPEAHHATWDMINRNIMTVESGLYYWTVEGPDGKTQIGKLVIIR